MLAVLGVCLYKKRVDVFAHGVSALVTLTLLGMSWIAGQLVPFLHTLAAIPVFVLFMTGRKAGLVWMGIVLVALGGLTTGELNGWLPPPVDRTLPALSVAFLIMALGVVGLAYDRARVRGELRLQAQVEESAAMLRAIPDTVYRIDARGIVLECSRVVDGETTLGRAFTDVVGVECEDELTATRGSNREHEMEVDAQRALSIRLVPLAQGHVLALVRDFSDARDLKRQLTKAELLAQLERVNRLSSVGVLAACMAHEINNPLAYLNANLEVVARTIYEAGGEESKGAMVDVLDAVHRIGKITADLRQYTRDEDTEPERLRLKDVAALALKMAQAEIKQHATVVEEHGNATEVLGVESRLVQVVLNLLINSAQALPYGDASAHRITVRTGVADDGFVWLSVQDTGPGISPENLARVTEAFFTTKQAAGTGLGLAVCEQIVRQAGGSLTLESEPGEGTLATVRLPPAGPRTTRPATAHRQVVLTPTGGGPVLVIDDEPLVRRALGRLLREHQVVEAVGGNHALELLQSDPRFDAVLCDVMMPDLSGLDVYTKALGSWPELTKRWILMTGGAFDPQVQDLLKSLVGELEVIDKPFDPQHLRDLINRTVGGSPQG